VNENDWLRNIKITLNAVITEDVKCNWDNQTQLVFSNHWATIQHLLLQYEINHLILIWTMKHPKTCQHKNYTTPKQSRFCDQLIKLLTTYNNNNCYQPFVWVYPDEPVPEETFTYSYLSCLSTNLYQLPPSTTPWAIKNVPLLFLR